MSESKSLEKRSTPSLISSWTPFSRDLDRVFNSMEQIMGSFSRNSDISSSFMPACDIDETRDEYKLTIDIPGVDKENIDIKVSNNTIKISGERKHENKSSENNESWYERSSGSFSRSITLPEKVDSDSLNAHHDNGVLYLSIPKKTKNEMKRVEIKSGKPEGGKSQASGKVKDNNEAAEK